MNSKAELQHRCPWCIGPFHSDRAAELIDVQEWYEGKAPARNNVVERFAAQQPTLIMGVQDRRGSYSPPRYSET
jgi:hypothetical protein